MDMDRHELLVRVKEGLAAGTLPCQDCLVRWYGRGRDHACAVCDLPITRFEREIECDLPGGGAIYFHSICHDLWHAALSA